MILDSIIILFQIISWKSIRMPEPVQDLFLFSKVGVIFNVRNGYRCIIVRLVQLRGTSPRPKVLAILLFHYRLAYTTMVHTLWQSFRRVIIARVDSHRDHGGFDFLLRKWHLFGLSDSRDFFILRPVSLLVDCRRNLRINGLLLCVTLILSPLVGVIKLSLFAEMGHCPVISVCWITIQIGIQYFG